MPSTCFTPIGGHTVRVIKLDACGVVLTGVTSCKIVSTGFVRVNRTAEYEEADEFIVKNANGDICVNERTSPVLKWLNLEIQFCSVDPEMFNLVSGAPLVMDDQATPVAIGFRTREGVIPSVNFALELWSRTTGTACAGGSVQYGYYLAPWVVQGTIGDLVFENGPISFTVNARTKAGSPWGVGPYKVWNEYLPVPATPAKLVSAITATDHDHLQLTTMPPPAAACGCATVTPDP